MVFAACWCKMTMLYLSWECPGHVLDMAKCPQIMQTACPIQTFEYWFVGSFMYVAPCTSSIIQKILKFSLFSAFLSSLDFTKQMNDLVPSKVFFHLKFRLLVDFDSSVLKFHRIGHKMVPTKCHTSISLHMVEVKVQIPSKFLQWITNSPAHFANINTYHPNKTQHCLNLTLS